MAQRISDWLYRVSTGWVTVLALLLFLIFTALVLPAQSNDASEFSAGTGSPDLELFYTPQQIYSWAEIYGEQGRSDYIYARFTFDLVWPLVYTFFFASATSWCFHRIIPLTSKLRLANITPLVAILLDYLENSSTSIIMWRYPSRSPVLDWLAPIFTFSKWVFVIGSFGLLLLGAVVVIVQLVQKRKHPI